MIFRGRGLDKRGRGLGSGGAAWPSGRGLVGRGRGLEPSARLQVGDEPTAQRAGGSPGSQFGEQGPGLEA